MKSYSIVAVVVLMTVGAPTLQPKLSAAQQSGVETNAIQNNAAGRPQTATSSQVPQTTKPGEAAFYILGEFTQSLNVKKLKAGDKINAEVTQDVLSHGRIIIPVESRLIGHVTEVKLRQGQDSESRLGIVFDKVLLRHKKEVDFRGVVHALSAPAQRPSRVDQPDPMMSPSMMGGAVARSTSPMPMGAGASPRSAVGAGSLSNDASIATNPAGSTPAFENVAPVTNVPTASAGNAAGGIPDGRGTPPVSPAQGQPMSVGMPLGVFGLKGLSLTPGISELTPGPVILSRVENVKLESGTQVLLRITGVTVPQP